jgi:hypothetical protein
MKKAIEFQFHDGGSPSNAKTRGDCVARSIAIATGRDYLDVFAELNRLGQTHERIGKRKRGISNARTGVYKRTIHRYMEAIGWKWTPTMGIGTGCTVHLRADELPPGRIVVALSRHCAAVIDGVLYDIHDCSREGTRCVYGYWSEGKP